MRDVLYAVSFTVCWLGGILLLATAASFGHYFSYKEPSAMKWITPLSLLGGAILFAFAFSLKAPNGKSDSNH
ncbi:MAG: hypothetical protein Q7S10_02870 [bacterium]|nr:hypothetical protein [bacterium]